MSEPGAVAERKLRHLSVLNLSRMGHCAPTIMQTLLDASGEEAEWLVKLTAGLRGGIGNTGGECGGVTAPLVWLGLRHAGEPSPRRLSMVVREGHELLRRFVACEGSLSCREIRGDARVPFRCVRVVQEAPVIYARTAREKGADALSPQREQAYALLQAHWLASDFHCARSVFRALGGARFEGGALHAASSAFMGGTLLTGGTCSALTAAIMALGPALGKIESSRPRVLRMLATMAIGGDAFADARNAFNEIMNLGHELAGWFSAEFGSSSCRTLTQCDFSTVEGVDGYVQNDGTTRCRAIVEAVAKRADELIRQRTTTSTA